MTDNEMHKWLEFQFHAVHDRFDTVDGRLNGLDNRITQNARERLADVEDLREDLREHKERNHGTSRIATSSVAGAIAAVVVAIFEAVRRLG